MKKSYSKEEKQEYFNKLRAQWAAAKKHSLNGGRAEIEAIMATHGMKVSMIGFMVVYTQMKSQGLDGIPYLDAKTFQGWKENGFKVRKGEKSTLDGITWVNVTTDKLTTPDGETSDISTYAMPKGYHLFHRSQVEPLTA